MMEIWLNDTYKFPKLRKRQNIVFLLSPNLLLFPENRVERPTIKVVDTTVDTRKMSQRLIPRRIDL